MNLSITLRIWLTVAVIVLIFTILVLYIVPSQQEKYFIRTFNQEVENLAKTVALGVDIALEEGNFQGVKVAMDFAQSDARLEFVALIEKKDSDRLAFLIYPEGYEVDINKESSDTLIVKLASFESKVMEGEIMVGFKTDEIVENMNKIRVMAIVVSIFVFTVGIILGLWLARTISTPVRAIRDAAIKVGEGDLTQQVGTQRKDEIGDLSRAFNKMVGDLSKAEDDLQEKNNVLRNTLEDLENKNELLSKEKKRSDNLLLNILPEETAEELKKFGYSKPKRFDKVTVFFSDFVKFTELSERLSPEILVKALDYSFKKFDAIMEKHGLEKIKTIGDAYLCVGGLPTASDDHTERCVRAALEIQDFLEENKRIRSLKDEPYFDARIGIHTGPLVAGIVGSNKFAYDIWGDTVNTASRLESSGVKGKVNISEATRAELINNDAFKFESRGKKEVKGKSAMEMYFVELVES